MRLLRFGKPGEEKPGVEWQGKKWDVSAHFRDYDETFFAHEGVEKLSALLQDPVVSLPELPADIRLGCPVKRPSKIVCIGLNYVDHAKETGAPLPPEPVVFMKATSAIIGPFDDVIIPLHSEKTDWEVELGVVIGKKASYVSEENAMDHVAGYVLHNDLSERAFQLERNGTWDKGKGCDSFAPIGPWLVTKDEVEDVHNLRLWLTVNGEKMQEGNTRNLIFNIPFIISYVSQFMSLLPGDIISTGTPAGVGLGMNPPRYLKPGDVMELGIDSLGTARQQVRAYQAEN